MTTADASAFFPSSFTLTIIKIVVISLIGIGINWFVRSVIKIPPKIQSRKGKVYITILRNSVSLVILFITLYLIFLLIGINITPLIASAGLIGILAGIGAHSILDDFIAGFFLTSQYQIAVGDYVRVGGSNLEGVVTSIGFKELTLKGLDGALIVIPNSQVANLTNFTYGKSYTRVDIPIKLTLPIDEIINIFSGCLETLRQEKKYTILDGSRVVGIKTINPGSVTVRTYIVTSFIVRETVVIDFNYILIKELEKRNIQFI